MLRDIEEPVICCSRDMHAIANSARPMGLEKLDRQDMHVSLYELNSSDR